MAAAKIIASVSLKDYFELYLTADSDSKPLW